MKLFLLKTNIANFYVVAETPNDAEQVVTKHIHEAWGDDQKVDVTLFSKVGTDDIAFGEQLGITIFDAVD